MTSLILTLLGEDRPGLVQSVAEVVAAHGGSWEESSLARLSGRFAGMVRVAAPDAAAAGLGRALAELGERRGLRVTLEPIDAAAEAAAAARGVATLTLEVIGLDREGIVRDVATALTRHGVNVDAWDSGVFNAPMSGERMFRAEARLAVPPNLDRSSLDAALDAVGEAMHVEVHLGPSEAAD